MASAKQHHYPVTESGDGSITVSAPGGYKFTLVDQNVDGGKGDLSYPCKKKKKQPNTFNLTFLWLKQ
mgnify:CR=1 FL=1